MSDNEGKYVYKTGRPRHFQSPQDMQMAIDEYFEETEKITVCGLSLHLGFVSRQSFLDYSGYSDEFSDTIKVAKQRVEQYYEEHLIGTGVAGSIFAIKNFGWTDKQEIDVTTTQNVEVELNLSPKFIKPETEEEND